MNHPVTNKRVATTKTHRDSASLLKRCAFGMCLDLVFGQILNFPALLVEPIPAGCTHGGGSRARSDHPRSVLGAQGTGGKRKTNCDFFAYSEAHDADNSSVVELIMCSFL